MKYYVRKTVENFSLSGYDQSIDDVIAYCKTDTTLGLSSEEVNTYIEKYGDNVIYSKKPSLWAVYFAPLFDTLIVIYLIMTGIMILLSFYVPDVRGQVYFWLFFIAFNMLLAIFQQYRAQKKVEELQKLTPPMAKVIRNGIRIEVLAANLVVGDILELGLGNRVPADARLISAENLTVNEASLTGESAATRKMHNLAEGLPTETILAERKNMVYLGSFIQTGNARAIVTSTGNDTVLGKIAVEMGEIQSIDIPLRKRVNALGKWLGFAMVAFLVLTFGFKISTVKSITAHTLAKTLTRSIITGMSVMPINIPLLTTVVLITGVLHMAQKNVIVKELAVVESLGRSSVLCSDKTGTITTSQMTVVKIWDTQQVFDVETENGTTIIQQDKTITAFDLESNLGFLIKTIILNNDASLVEVDISKEMGKKKASEFQIMGNTTDGALMKLALAMKLDIFSLKRRYEKVKGFPFDSKLKRMSGIFRDTKDGQLYVFNKGASSVMLERCTKLQTDGKIKKFAAKQKQQVQEKINEFANTGYRVVSLAYKLINSVPKDLESDTTRATVEEELVYLGFMCILDPPRPGVREAVAKLDEAGIFPIMITGDAPTTAGNIAKRVGILDPDELVIEGKQILELSDEEFFKVSVFARVSPDDKKIIVDRYQKKGEVVAMTGDGVNDALAITRADAGIAMGITGTEVAKEAANIILADDSYVSLVNGVAEGRNLYERIRIMIFFYIAVNVAEAAVYFIASFLYDFILTDIQRTYIFTIVHAFPPLAIIFGKDDKNIMHYKPRDNDAILSKKMIGALILFMLTFASSILLVYYLYFTGNGFWGLNNTNLSGFLPIIQQNELAPTSLHHAKARTMMLTVLYIVESLIVLNIRRFNLPVRESIKSADKFVWTVILIPLFIHLSMLYSPIQGFLNLTNGTDILRLSFVDLLVAIGFAMIPLVALEIYKKGARTQNIQF